MTVIDSQIHIWAAEAADRPWLSNAASYSHGASFTARELLQQLDAAGVDRAILVPPSWEGDRNDVCMKAVQDHPARFGFMGRLDVRRPLAPDELHEHVASAGMLGLRLTFRQPDVLQLLNSGAVDWLWGAAAAGGICLSIYAPYSIDAIERIAGDHPDLKVIIDHIGLPLDVRDEAAFPIVDRTCELAYLGNVAIKATCLPSNVTEPYPFPRVQTMVHRVVDAFGADRVFWGSDLSRLPCSYDECVGLFRNEMTGLSDGDRKKILGDGIANWLGWRIQPPASGEGSGTR